MRFSSFVVSDAPHGDFITLAVGLERPSTRSRNGPPTTASSLAFETPEISER